MKWIRWISGWFGSATKSAGSLGVGLRGALGSGAPGGWASDHREETAHNTGFNYIAIHAIASQVAGATVTVFADGSDPSRRQSQRKSLALRAGSFTRWKSIYGAEDRETDPLPMTHPLVRLFKLPNPYESGASFRYRQAQQIRLTGTCLVWNVPSVSGPTCERYVIPTSMASPVAPTAELPRGGWRINPVASRYTPIIDDGYIECPSWYRILGQIVDARQVQVIRLPHAWYLDDGQSPLSAGAKWVDAGEAVDEARYHQLKNGIDPSIVWNLPSDVSADQDEIDRVQAKISAKYGGPENVGRVMVAQNGTSITPLTTSPKEMCYPEGFQDMKSAVLALHQTPPVAVGLQEPGAYAAYNASMKAWRHSAIQPLCDLLAESDTEHLAPQFGTGLTVEIESDTVDDTELIERQLQNDLAARVRTKNEWRAVRGMPPLPSPQGDELVGTDSNSPSKRSSTSATPEPQDSALHSIKGNVDRVPRNQLDVPSKLRHRSTDFVQERSIHFDPTTLTASNRRAHNQQIPDDESHPESQLSCTDGDNSSDDQDDSIRHRLIAGILYGLLGLPDWDLNEKSWLADRKAFDPSRHPRDEFGRFTIIASPEEIASARELVSKLLRGERSPGASDELIRKLSFLPTAVLESLHREHGVVPPPRIRSHLLRGLRARIEQLPGPDARSFRPPSRSNGVDIYLQHPEELHRRLSLTSRGEDRAPLTSEQWGHLVGAQTGARVYVFPGQDDAPWVEIFVDHPDYRARRRVWGKGVIENVEMRVSRRNQKSGLATRILKQQVDSARELGFHSIAAGAAGKGTDVRTVEETYPGINSHLGGYYTWARLGFEGKIDSLMKARAQSKSPELEAIAADFARKFPGVKTVSKLMMTEEGRTWWKKNGGYFEGTFDLKAGSRSQQILTEYLKETGGETKQKTLSDAPDDSWLDETVDGCENPDPLTPEDERILDEIWDRIALKEAPPERLQNQSVPVPSPEN